MDTLKPILKSLVRVTELTSIFRASSVLHLVPEATLLYKQKIAFFVNKAIVFYEYCYSVHPDY